MTSCTATEPCLPALQKTTQSDFTRLRGDVRRFQLSRSSSLVPSEEGHWRCLRSAMNINVCVLVSNNKRLTEQLSVCVSVCLKLITTSKFSLYLDISAWGCLTEIMSGTRNLQINIDNRVKHIQAYYIKLCFLTEPNGFSHSYDVYNKRMKNESLLECKVKKYC